MNDGGASDGGLPRGAGLRKRVGGDLLNFKTCSLITKLFEAKRKVFRPAAVQEAKQKFTAMEMFYFRINFSPLNLHKFLHPRLALVIVSS